LVWTSGGATLTAAGGGNLGRPAKNDPWITLPVMIRSLVIPRGAHIAAIAR
jgi:hypothetical protein